MENTAIAMQQPGFSKSEAKSLVDFLTQRNDLIVLTERNLATLERSWTGSDPPDFKASALNEGDSIYAMLECATYMNPSWEIVREITYLAIPKAAFDILIKLADCSKWHHGIDPLSEIVRPCSDHVLNDAVVCLRAGSPSQILMAAVRYSSFALYSLPDRQRLDYAPPTEAIGFEQIRHSRLRDVISRFQRMSGMAYPKKLKNMNFKIELDSSFIEERRRAITRCRDISLIRVTENQNDFSQQQSHEVDSCARCRELGQSTVSHVRRADHIELSAHGVALVESLNLASNAHATHDVYLFVVGGYKEIADQAALTMVIEDVFRSGKFYSTTKIYFPRTFDVGKVMWYDTI